MIQIVQFHKFIQMTFTDLMKQYKLEPFSITICKTEKKNIRKT